MCAHQDRSLHASTAHHQIWHALRVSSRPEGGEAGSHGVVIGLRARYPLYDGMSLEWNFRSSRFHGDNVCHKCRPGSLAFVSF